MEVLDKTEQKLAIIEDFNGRLGHFHEAVSDMENWITEARSRIDDIIKPSTESHFSPEDRSVLIPNEPASTTASNSSVCLNRVTKTMEIQEDLFKRSDFLKKQEAEKKDLFPAEANEMPPEAER